MNRRKTLVLLVLSVLCLQAIIFIKIPTASANGEIPQEYYQQLDLNGTYIYNITAFEGPRAWLNLDYDASQVWKTLSTEAGGQLIITLTGFYNRHVNDTWGFYNKFPHVNMPYMDINITNASGAVVIARTNCSNGEIFNNLALGHNPFDSGMLIPNNMTYVKNLAKDSSTENGQEHNVEESYNFIRLYFRDAFQETELIYDRITGLLVEANLTAGNYHLAIFLSNFSLDFNKAYEYDISEFVGVVPINYPDYSHAGYMFSNPGGKVIVNFTGINQGIPYMDVNVSYNRFDWLLDDIVLESVFMAENLSNLDLSYNLIMGYDELQVGFLYPNLNVTEVAKLAVEQASDDPLNNYDVYGEIEVKESYLTIKIKFNQIGGNQYTYLILEKATGLLLWAQCGFGNFKLELTINGFKAPSYSQESETPGTPEIPGFPLLMISFASVSALSIIIWKFKCKTTYI